MTDADLDRIEELARHAVSLAIGVPSEHVLALVAEVRRLRGEPAKDAPAPPAGVVWCQRWNEQSRSFGQRPYGYSLHASLADAKAYVRAAYAGRGHDVPSWEIPDEYDVADGEPYRVEVDAATLAEIEASPGRGVRRHKGKAPERVAATRED